MFVMLGLVHNKKVRCMNIPPKKYNYLYNQYFTSEISTSPVVLFVCLFVCFGSVTAFVPRGQLPREDLRRAPLPPRPLVTPGPRCSSCPLSPRTYVMHPVSGQYPPPSSCPVQISYQVSGLPPPCLPVLTILEYESSRMQGYNWLSQF